MFTVNQNAYLIKAREIENYSSTHERILMFLLHEKKYFSKDEILCFSGFDRVFLDVILEDLNKTGIIEMEGWLVRISPIEKLNEIICEELIQQ